MGSVVTLARKELRHIFLSPIAYVFILAFANFVVYMFFRSFFLAQQVSMASFFTLFPFAFAIVIPGMTMGTWSEERKQGTIELLLTSPVQTWQVVTGKFIGSLSLVALCLLLTLMVPYTVGMFGDLDSGPVWGGYLGALLMGGTCIAVGMFCSSLARDQIVGFLLGIIVLLGMVLVGMPFIQTEFAPGSLMGTFFRVISPTTHFESIGRGVIDIRDLYYFAAFSGLFLYFNARVIEVRRRR